MANTRLPLDHIKSTRSKEALWNLFDSIKSIEHKHEKDVDELVKEREAAHEKNKFMEAKMVEMKEMTEEWDSMKSENRVLHKSLKQVQNENWSLRCKNRDLVKKMQSLEQKVVRLSKVAELAKSMGDLQLKMDALLNSDE